MHVEETYSPLPLAASGIVLGIGGGDIGGFLCTTAGTVKLNLGLAGADATIVDTCAVTAGQFVPMPFAIPAGTAVYATLGGGAKGTFAVNNS